MGVSQSEVRSTYTLLAGSWLNHPNLSSKNCFENARATHNKTVAADMLFTLARWDFTQHLSDQVDIAACPATTGHRLNTGKAIQSPPTSTYSNLLLNESQNIFRISLFRCKCHDFHMGLHPARLAIWNPRLCNDGIVPDFLSSSYRWTLAASHAGENPPKPMYKMGGGVNTTTWDQLFQLNLIDRNPCDHRKTLLN